MYRGGGALPGQRGGAGAGTLLLLDDLQWAGRRCAGPARHAGPLAACRPPRCACIGAYRDTEVQPQDPLSVTLADLAHAGLATQHTLEPLALEEAAQLLDGLLDGSPAKTRWRRRRAARAGGAAGGRRAVLPGELCPGAASAGRGSRRGGRRAVGRGAGRAPAGGGAAGERASVLGAAAVVGRVVPPAILVAVATQPEEEVLAALDAASRARLLMDEGHAYRFAHDVIREVIEADVGTARRLLLHRQVAAAIEDSLRQPAGRALRDAGLPLSAG